MKMMNMIPLRLRNSSRALVATTRCLSIFETERYFTETTANSVFTEANKPLEWEWKLPHKIEELYPEVLGPHWQDQQRATEEHKHHILPRGRASLQLYSLATPNGQKAGILLEELDVHYDAHVVDILKGYQFADKFRAISPNAKIPALVDTDGGDHQEPICVFESGSILIYLAEKYGKFLSTDRALRTDTFNWIFWQMSGMGPTAGQFNHFMHYAPKAKHEARHYGIARYGWEWKRLCSVLDNRLANREYLVGDEYSIADMACFPWFHYMRKESKYKTIVSVPKFLSMDDYKHANKWADRILERDAVKRGLTVCSFSGKPKPWIRSHASDDV